MNETCPLCGGDIEAPHQVSVCGTCHHELLSNGDVAVGATAEFRTPPALLAQIGKRRPRPSEPPPGAIACTWCGKSAGEVAKLLSQGSAHICNQCVGLCADILTAELGDDWRS